MADYEGVNVSDRTCSVAQCGRVHHSQGLCSLHYKRKFARKSSAMEPLPGEVWRLIPGYGSHYLVSSMGRVAGRFGSHIQPPPIKKLTVKKWGYRAVRLVSEPGTPGRMWMVHRLVLLAFNGPCPAEMEIRHLDGDPTNNNLQNLRYGTSSENSYDTVRHGRHPARSKTHCKNGHEFTEANTIIRKSGRDKGRRRCLACKSQEQRARMAQRSAV